ncbi:MAG TPA: hypothetical protein PLY51_05405 [Microthrixaceae bacterium]|nr:hypothetical protein [Myxococcota bacterium]HNH94983.1 hypothetical protein [Microthrixaceae bacterium]
MTRHLRELYWRVVARLIGWSRLLALHRPVAVDRAVGVITALRGPQGWTVVVTLSGEDGFRALQLVEGAELDAAIRVAEAWLAAPTIGRVTMRPSDGGA